MSGKKVTLTYDRHTAQRGYEWRWGEAVGSKVSQLPDTHENHATPPHHGGVVGFGATLSLTDVGIFLSGRDGERAWGTSQIKERQKNGELQKATSNMQHMGSFKVKYRTLQL